MSVTTFFARAPHRLNAVNDLSRVVAQKPLNMGYDTTAYPRFDPKDGGGIDGVVIR